MTRGGKIQLQFSDSIEKGCSHRMKKEEKISVSLKIMGRSVQGIYSQLVPGLQKIQGIKIQKITSGLLKGQIIGNIRKRVSLSWVEEEKIMEV